MEMINKINVGGEDKGIGANEFLCEYYDAESMPYPLFLVTMLAYLQVTLNKNEFYAIITGDTDRHLIEEFFNLQNGAYITTPNNKDGFENAGGRMDVNFQLSKLSVLGEASVISLRFDNIFIEVFLSQYISFIEEISHIPITPNTVYTCMYPDGTVVLSFVNPLLIEE